MKTWSFLALGRSYEITDYGPRFGIEVTRDGYTVWTGYREGARLVTDTTTLPARELLALREELLRRASSRSAAPQEAGRRTRRPQRAGEQLDLLGAMILPWREA
ncbi:hypothetical protein BE20_36990 [Sorangium cellulosum]|uniref:Uncharacterized protein n=1 Tax=Sorangium cellulosum TaxID=56 RepID=A0A150SF53_SORCE|nr:hypothetical protein BE18_04560 [Sorangium cellulosum]KYF97908.1 hypothetical protein BE20_36990 [Sorangium cellulosum]